MKVSHSKLQTWRRCKRKYHYKYIEGLERRLKALPLFRGSIIHDLLNERANGGDWRKILKKLKKKHGRLFDEEVELYGDIIGESEVLMTNYEREHGSIEEDDLKPVQLKGFDTFSEFSFEVPVAEDILFTGIIDMVAKDSEKRIWVMEHKTHARFPSEDQRLSDIQTVLYCFVLREMGFPKPTGVAWDYIRTKLPKKPDLLKNGGLSKRKRIDTDYQTYLDTVLEHGLDPDDYQDILETLKGKEFFRRIFLPVSDSLSRLVVEDVIETAREIEALEGEFKARTLTKDCSWCDFFELCQTELRELDSEYLKTHQYKRRSKDHDNKKEEHAKAPA